MICLRAAPATTCSTVEPMTTETLFDLASVSKCVGTTLAFMQLIENGYVRLTDNVDRYIPNFKPWKDPESGETVDITVRDLLSHSSGLTPYINADTFASALAARMKAKRLLLLTDVAGVLDKDMKLISDLSVEGPHHQCNR